ncbi:hypothetical protein MCOR27_008924 [Pyricularia oryzae]|uniref:non-reducing end alpha-L-arabinofuranosidase n=1 Tax=Pyricularia grisea TaxID=148305 RepID=A0ABQ8NCQ4_PYRGI|nr:hypothetical protein MCOR01_010437 [Pyricularia oryzae]KAI6294131.1 hypothetical protein MCOR33_008659 [Pyricularia grisea]KAH9438581.1 hypothetical protein MCOR02_002197 [Pyricularia oryzae]KAI6260873.1 hypothetical protein MCOR19_002855 [Pyricularia oryzae]KAI6271177.1 hypothetical protein MCOR27_008924 [Pyricularia oryzae]
MATFTRQSDDDEPAIFVNPAHKIAKIEDNTYGGFTEHMGRCIYGGIYDPGNSLSDQHGFRTDVIEAFKELNCPVVRYPGGNFVATYHWQEGIGPKEKRPKKLELAWKGIESNEFGTDEFMKWCEIVGTEPYIALNFGTGTLDEAMGWLEYCNSSADSHYANLRRQNGRDKPYNVKYWALGNECYGDWQVAQMNKEDYAKKAWQWAKALKLIDPTIQLILCGENGHSTWDYYVTHECISPSFSVLKGSATLIDMHSIHIYTASAEHLENATAPRSAERAIEITSSLIDLARIENKVPPSIPRQKICFDEWNVWDPERALGHEGAEEKYTLSDALAVAVWLNVFVRQAEHLGMANIAQSVNVISPLMTTSTGVYKQTTWWPLLLFSRHMRGHTVAVHVQSGEYDGPTKPVWIRGTIETPWLDVSASVNDDGVVSLVVVNIHEHKSFSTRLHGVKPVEGGHVEVYTVTGPNVKSRNTEEKQEVGITESKWDGKGPYEFPKASMTMLRWKP